MVAPSVTLHLIVDPASPLAMPDIKFLGAEQRVASLQRALLENVENWAEDEPLLTNLERLLDLCFGWKNEDEDGREVLLLGGDIHCGVSSVIRYSSSSTVMVDQDHR